MLCEASVMPFVSSANISCGLHAGDEKIIRQTIDECLKYGIGIGAHPSYPDRENFGRKDMNLNASVLEACIFSQLSIFQNWCKSAGAKMRHVKPHGSLYNRAARDAQTAALMADVVYRFDENLLLYGLSHSESLHAARLRGLGVVSEFFADRAYLPDGTLKPRGEPGAVLEDPERAARQSIQLAEREGEKRSESEGSENISSPVRKSICVHGDNPHAAEIAKRVNEALTLAGYTIRPW